MRYTLFARRLTFEHSTSPQVKAAVNATTFAKVEYPCGDDAKARHATQLHPSPQNATLNNSNPPGVPPQNSRNTPEVFSIHVFRNTLEAPQNTLKQVELNLFRFATLATTARMEQPGDSHSGEWYLSRAGHVLYPSGGAHTQTDRSMILAPAPGTHETRTRLKEEERKCNQIQTSFRSRRGSKCTR